jgi:phage terminase large subunit-like protein
VQSVRYDPYQMAAVAQRLQRQGLPTWEFPQTVGNLTEASNNLFELIKGRNLVAYSDPDLKLAISRAIALESPRGWHIVKAKTSHKIVILVDRRRLGSTKDAAGPSLVDRHIMATRHCYLIQCEVRIQS